MSSSLISSPPTSSTLLGPTPPRRPTKEDWDSHRELLTRLWFVEDRTLSDVVSIMAAHHGHIATKKMYRDHFKKWNLEKKIKACDAHAILRKKRERDEAGKETAIILRGRAIDIEDVDRYAKRRKGEPLENLPRAATPSYIFCGTPPPRLEVGSAHAHDMQMDEEYTTAAQDGDVIKSGGYSGFPMLPTQDSHGMLQRTNPATTLQPYCSDVLYSPSTPPSLRIPEHLFYCIQAYFRGSCESGAWVTGNDGHLRPAARTRSVGPSTLVTYIEMAVHPPQKIISNIEFRRMLSKGFSMIRDLLQTQHPDTLRSFLAAFYYLLHTGRMEIASMLGRYISQMATILLPRDHPWRQICRALGTLNMATFEESIAQCWKCITGTLEACIGPFHTSTISTRQYFINFVYGDEDLGEEERMLRELLTQLDQHRPEISPMHVTRVMVSLGNNFLYQGKNKEAEKIGQDLIFQAERNAGPVSVIDIVIALELVAHSQYYQLKDDLAERNIRKALRLCEATWGMESPLAGRLMVQLETWLRGWGREDEAEELRTQTNERLGLDEMDEALACVTL